MAEDAESDIAIRFVDENDSVSAKRKLKKNRLPRLFWQRRWKSQRKRGGSCNRNGECQWNTRKRKKLLFRWSFIADESKSRKSAGNPKPAPSSSTVTKSSKKAPQKSNKRNKSLSEEEMERFPFPRWAPTHFALIFRNALDLFTLSLPFARHVLHGV